jgi:multidrug efflux pump
MTISDFSVRRPVFATVISLLIVAFGVLAFSRLPVRELPDIDAPIVSVETNYRGAAASVIESRITEVIENRLSGVEGLKSITSSSRDGRSSINVEFELSRNIDDAANDVRDRVSGVLNNLPEEADPPEVSKVDADAQPIMFIGLRGNGMSQVQLADYAERNLVDRFTAIDGVARVAIGGSSKPAMRVWLNRQSMAALEVTANDVEIALRTQNVELPAGRLESQRMNYTLRVSRQYESVQDFASLVVKRGSNGYFIRLGDVARIEVGAENPYTAFRSDGIPTVAVTIIRQSNANTLEVSQKARDLAIEINKNLPKGMSFSLNFDSSVFIAEAIKNVYKTLSESALLVVLVIFLFLGSMRATLMPAVAVPVSLLGAALVLWAFGFSLNLLTLLAFVLAIGLVVDDAIVVLENIYHRIEEGDSPLVAAYIGTRQVGFAVVASTLVVVAVFVPVLFIGGNSGRLFSELAAAMVGALIISLLISLTLTPAMASKVLKANRKPYRFNLWVDRQFNKLSVFYGKTLQGFTLRPLLAIGLLLFTVGVIFVTFKLIKSELAPEEDTGIFFVNAQLVEGAGFDYTSDVALKAEKSLLTMAQKDTSIFRVVTRLPGNGGGGPATEFNTAGFTVVMRHWDERTATTQEAVQKAQKLLGEQPAFRVNVTQRQSLSGGRGRPINFVISGGSYEELAKARDAILRAAESNPGIQGLEADYRETKPQLLIDVNRNRAAELGLSQTAIGRTLETMMGSRRVSTYIDRGEEYDVLLQADRTDRMSVNDLANSYVRSERTGALIPLSNVVTIRELADAGTLGRYNKLRSITLSGGIAPGYSLGEALTFLEAEAAKQPEVTAVGYKGESREFRESSNALYFVLSLAVLVIFLLLAAQFESFVHPFTIILTVPMALGGALLGLWIMGGTLNLYSQVAIIMLVGLATKNGILIVEFANQLRDAGRSIRDAVIEAAQRRLRPILMTSVATISGALPLMLSSGAGSAARQQIGIVIVFGVAFATLLTLIVIPSIYALLARFTRSPEAVQRDLESQLASANHIKF